MKAFLAISILVSVFSVSAYSKTYDIECILRGQGLITKEFLPGNMSNFEQIHLKEGETKNFGTPMLGYQFAVSVLAGSVKVLAVDQKSKSKISSLHEPAEDESVMISVDKVNSKGKSTHQAVLECRAI